MRFEINLFLFLFVIWLIYYSFFGSKPDRSEIEHLKYEISSLKLDIAGLKTIMISNLLKIQTYEANQRVAPQPKNGERSK